MISANNGLYDEIQYFRKITDKSVLSVVSAFSIDKVKIEFRQFSPNGEKGNKVTSSVDFYMSPGEFEVLCRDIVSGNIAKEILTQKNKAQSEGRYQQPTRCFIGGNKKTMQARQLTITGGDRLPFILTAYIGKGKINPKTNGLTPDFKFNEADAKVMVGLTTDEFKQFAWSSLRALDYYYSPSGWFMQNQENNLKQYQNA